MESSSSFARQAAAAELWMELTGRKEAAAFELAIEKMEAAAVEKAAGALENVKESLIPFYAHNKRKKQQQQRQASLAKSRAPWQGMEHFEGFTREGQLPHLISPGAGRIYDRVYNQTQDASKANAAALKHPDVKKYENKHGVRLLELDQTHEGAFKFRHEKKAAKLSKTQQRLIGAGVAGTAAGLGGGLSHYLAAKSGRNDTPSKHELAQEAALARFDALSRHAGRDPEQLKGPRALKRRYRQALLAHARKARENPAVAAAVGSVPYALAGGLAGAAAGPTVMG